MNNFLSKENTTSIYKNIIMNAELKNITKEQKDNIINQLINVMKRIYKTLDLNKITKENIILVKQQYNDIVVKQTVALIKENSVSQSNDDINKRANDRLFGGSKRPVPVPGNDRPSSIGGNPHGPAPSSSTADFIKRASEDVNKRLADLEESRRAGNERKGVPDIPDFLKPIKVGKQIDDNKPSYDSKPSESKPFLSGFSTIEDSNYSSSVPKTDPNKYNENLSTQDRLKQLEIERGMPTHANEQPPQQYQSAPQMQPTYQPQQNIQPVQQYQPQQNMQPTYQSAPQMQPTYQPQQNMQPTQNNIQIEQMMNKLNEMQHVILNLTNENNYLKSQMNNNQKKNSTRTFQLEVNKKDSVYNYQFNPVNNITNIKLVSYNLPQAIYNIINDTTFNYKMNNQSNYIMVPKGFYNITNLLELLNKNNHLIFSVDTSQKISIKATNEIGFQIIPNELTTKLGFIHINETSIVTYLLADRLYDLRTPNKLLFYIKNIYPDKPVGVLNFNGSSICELNFNQPISLNNLLIEFYTEDNILYNFNDIMYNLSFVIEINEN